MSKSILIYCYLLLFLLLSSCRSDDNEIKAYHVLNEGLEASIKSVNNKIQGDTHRLGKIYKDVPEAIKDLWNKALKISKISNDLFDNIQSIKDSLIEFGGGIRESGEIRKAKNSRIAYKLLRKNDRGILLIKNLTKAQHELTLTMNNVEGIIDLNEFAESNIFIIPRKYRHKSLEIIYDTTEKWVENYFKNVQIIEALCYLTSLQNDIRITQYNLISSLLASIGTTGDGFDRNMPVIKTEKSYLRRNEQLKADIFLGRWNSKINLDVFMKGKHHKSKRGVVRINPSTSSRGSFRIPCKIVGTKFDGDTILTDSLTLYYNVL